MTQEIELADLPEFLEGIGTQLEDAGFEDRMDELVPLVQGCIRQGFHDQTTPGGDAWAPLSPATIAMKGRRSGIIGPHSTILVDTGRLYESLTTPNGTQDTVWITGDWGLTFGTSVEYSIFHDEGTSRMPARVHVGLNDQTTDEIAARVGDFVVEKMRG